MPKALFVAVALSSLPSFAGTFSNGCMDGKAFDAGLCYAHCKDGFTGVGPVCWASCPDGYHDDGALCRKPIKTAARGSYGRGVGHALGCASGQDMSSALCYPSCKAGYHGVGPVCWEVCGEGHHDFGAFCGTHAKKSYGRGVGKPLSACSGGQEKDGALCYPACKAGYRGVGPVCWQSCPAGFKDLGAGCGQGGEVITKQSYGRGAGTVPPLCTSKSINKAVPSDSGPRAFTMLFASDTQFPWWRTGNDPSCNSDECVMKMGLLTNREQLSAMNAIESFTLPTGKKASAPLGLIINGDLTAYWHPNQADLFEAFYNDKAMLKWPLYPGLGNHDYSNNNPETGGKTQGCWWTRDADTDFTLGVYGCANNASNWMRATIACNKVPSFPAGKVQSFDNDSLAYSWNIGKWHFVQLHLNPEFKLDKIGIKPSVAWLKADLAAATKAGRYSVLNMHDYQTAAADPAFVDALRGNKVVAIFAGHIHGQWGRVSGYADLGIPVYFDGASEYQTFLVAEFADDHLTVASVSSKGGKPAAAEQDSWEDGNKVVHHDVTAETIQLSK